VGKRGPAPQPTKLKLLSGNPGKQPLPKNESQPTGKLVRPDIVTGEAAREWDRAINAMPPGLYTSADAPTLAVYCISWVLFRNALAQVARTGTTAEGSMGQRVVSPHLLIAVREREMILKSAAVLGMSPAARAGLTMDDQDEAEDRFAGLWGGAQLQLVTPPKAPRAEPRRTRPTSLGPPAA
jgi:P27 family predicted phage terminase small subunit